jgi:DNA-binding MarR family transcriptional regulator
MISNILTLLEKKKYIIRQKSQAMLTGMKLSLSKTGQVLIDKAHKAVEEIEQVLSDTKEPKKLKKNLRKIIDTL